jgi:hypothetical protein
MWLLLSLGRLDERIHLVNHNWWLHDFLSLGSLALAGCGGWHHVKCVRDTERERERERVTECLEQTDISKAQKAEFLLQQDFSYMYGMESCNSHFLLTDWMAKSYKRAYHSFMSNLEDLYSPAATSYWGLYECLPHPTYNVNCSLNLPPQPIYLSMKEGSLFCFGM